jgi:hypothetical protein
MPPQSSILVAFPASVIVFFDPPIPSQATVALVMLQASPQIVMRRPFHTQLDI